MDIGALISWIVLGAVAGWLSNKIVFKQSNSIFNTTIIGILGSIFGGYIGTYLDIDGTAVGGLTFASILTATLGAIALTFIARLVFKK